MPSRIQDDIFTLFFIAYVYGETNQTTLVMEVAAQVIIQRPLLIAVLVPLQAPQLIYPQAILGMPTPSTKKLSRASCLVLVSILKLGTRCKSC